MSCIRHDATVFGGAMCYVVLLFGFGDLAGTPSHTVSLLPLASPLEYPTGAAYYSLTIIDTGARFGGVQ